MALYMEEAAKKLNSFETLSKLKKREWRERKVRVRGQTCAPGMILGISWM